MKLLIDQLRSEHAQAQRRQFDSEKNIAVADTSIQNLERALTQQEDRTGCTRTPDKTTGF